MGFVASSCGDEVEPALGPEAQVEERERRTASRSTASSAARADAASTTVAADRLEADAQRAADVLLVVDDQDRQARHARPVYFAVAALGDAGAAGAPNWRSSARFSGQHVDAGLAEEAELAALADVLDSARTRSTATPRALATRGDLPARRRPG